MTLNAGDWIEIDFIGKIKSNNNIFDLTLADVAKKEKIFDEKRKYKPLVACLGKGHLIKGLDEAFLTKDVGQEFDLDIEPENAFGQKNPSLMQITNINIFKKQGFTPITGMQVSVDGMLATVRSVTGGRVVIDFNHPLSGRALHYWVKINRKVEKDDEKVKAVVSLMTGEEVEEVKQDEKEVTIKTKTKLPEQAQDLLKKQIFETVPDVAKKALKFE